MKMSIIVEISRTFLLEKKSTQKKTKQRKESKKTKKVRKRKQRKEIKKQRKQVKNVKRVYLGKEIYPLFFNVFKSTLRSAIFFNYICFAEALASSADELIRFMSLTCKQDYITLL